MKIGVIRGRFHLSPGMVAVPGHEDNVDFRHGHELLHIPQSTHLVNKKGAWPLFYMEYHAFSAVFTSKRMK